MLRADSSTGRVARIALAAILSMVHVGVALAGGPLWVVPTKGKSVQAAKWATPVQVDTDKGPLSVGCERDNPYSECTLDASGNQIPVVFLTQQAGDQLVASSLAQWSGVPTSSFRATVRRTMPIDIVGANVNTVIGAWNGGGVQVIYDADDSVIAELTGGSGYGVLGIGSPEYLAAEGSTQIVEGWLIIGGSWLETTSSDPISGIVTHEIGHVINLSHSQTNGFYSANDPNRNFGIKGPEEAGPDQCGHVMGYPTSAQIETMYPLINPYPETNGYNSPQMATVDLAEDQAALSSIYPSASYSATTGTIRGRVVAKDGKSQITGVNVIARRVGSPFSGAISRISGDLTQGITGPDGAFVMTGLVPGASYVLHTDELGLGAFSTGKAVLMGPEEFWNFGESADATVDDACVSTPLVLAAGEVRQIELATNGIAKAPTFIDVGYGYANAVSDNGQKVLGLFGNNQSPYWLWDNVKKGQQDLGGSGFLGTISGNGAVVGGTIGVQLQTEYGPINQGRAAIWKSGTGWKSIAPAGAGCFDFQSAVWDLTRDGALAVGNFWQGCGTKDVYATVFNTKTATMQFLPKAREEKLCSIPDSDETFECEGDSRANAVSADGRVIGGYESFPELGIRAGVIWRGNELELLRDPTGDNPGGGYVGEVMAVNGPGTVAVGGQIGPELLEAYKWTPATGVTALGRLRGPYCYLDFDTFEQVCVVLDRETFATSVSDDGKVIGGLSYAEAALYTPQLGWMLLKDFLATQGVLEASRWSIFGMVVSGDGKTLVGSALPLAADYYHAFQLDLGQVFVCHGRGKGGATQRVTFPDGMDMHLAHGDQVGLCPGQAPL